MDNPPIQSAKNGNFRNIARCISLIEQGLLPEALYTHSSDVPLVGITGPPGAGKSTLLDALIGNYVEAGLKVAVVCIDPSSPFHRGAILGDRIRMNRWFGHPKVYIRSLSNRGAMGGLHPRATEITAFLSQCGFDLVLLETVGVGQSEVEVVKLADAVVVVLVPEAGDDVQFMKSGLMEAGDVFVVNKADRPGAYRFAAGLKQELHHQKVVSTQAVNGEGVDELVNEISQFLKTKNKPIWKK